MLIKYNTGGSSNRSCTSAVSLKITGKQTTKCCVACVIFVQHKLTTQQLCYKIDICLLSYLLYHPDANLLQFYAYVTALLSSCITEVITVWLECCNKQWKAKKIRFYLGSISACTATAIASNMRQQSMLAGNDESSTVLYFETKTSQRKNTNSTSLPMMHTFL